MFSIYNNNRHILSNNSSGLSNYKTLSVSNNGVIDYSQLDGHRPIAVYVTGSFYYSYDKRTYSYTGITIGDIWATHNVMNWDSPNESSKATSSYSSNITITYSDAQGYCTIGGSGLFMPSTLNVCCFY